MTEGSQGLEWMSQIQAVLFDMDGTLLDSEHLAAKAIDMLLAEHGLHSALQGPWFHGLTWRSIAKTLRMESPVLSDVPVEAALEAHFHTALVSTAPPAIPGAPQAVIAASGCGGTAVVSSSNRASVQHVVERLGLQAHLQHMVSAEDCERSKPDPQCFQIAAERLGVACERCLVFEDSVAGLTAGRAAKMRTIAIGRHHAAAGVAEYAIADFTELPDGFFDAMGAS
jgi:HAD superfamily hydrolase (TIGR01509 family)